MFNYGLGLFVERRPADRSACLLACWPGGGVVDCIKHSGNVLMY